MLPKDDSPEATKEANLSEHPLKRLPVTVIIETDTETRIETEGGDDQ